MNWRILLTRLGGLGLVGATTTGAVLSFGEDIPQGVEGERWDFMVRKSDHEIKGRKPEWKFRNIERTNNNGTIVIGQEMWVEEGEDVVWRCGIRGVVVGEPKGESGIEEQFRVMRERIENDGEARGRFVDNCALNRLDEEREDGGESEIELEIVSGDGKYEIKGLERVYGEDNVRGHRRLNRNERKVWREKGNEILIGSNRVGVLNLYHLGRVFCVMHGDREEDGKLVYGDDAFQKQLNNIGGERRKYIIKNCLKYSEKGNIYGLKVVKDKSSWKFRDMRSITDGVYTVQQ